MVYSFFTGRR